MRPLSARGLGGALIALVAVVAAAPGVAAAQSKRYPPEPRDLDQDVEEESEFWEHALHPERGLYEERTSHAARLIEARAPETWEEAEELLAQAIESEPDLPLAYWLLGRLHEQELRFADCADAYGRAAAADPTFEPPKDPRRGYALGYAIGVCQSRAGDFDAAIATYERMVRAGTDNFEVLLRLGESYMAVGRMDDAIDTLERAAGENAASAPIYYALAVAYDRDGRAADARGAMEKAIRLDPQLTQLESPKLSYAPVEDIYYYLGLAREIAALNETAIFSFRRYLHESSVDRPWRRRAQRHLATLAAAGFGDRFQLTGSEDVDAGKVKKILAAADADLQECLRSAPNLLLSARVTIVVPSKADDAAAAAAVASGNAVARAQPAAGAKTLLVDVFATSPDEAEAARTCVERVAEALPLPRPDPRKGGYLSLVFPVIFRK
jgi:tetratricopeptide (TPR) repeat protein